MAKRQVTNKKKDCTRCHARLCGRGNSLKALGFVADYLTIVIFYRTNGINADTGVTDNSLIVCYVEVYGDFTVASPFASKDTKPTILHHGQMVFDGVTGNMLVIGVVP